MHALYTGRNVVTGFYRRQVGAALVATCISAALLAQMAMPADTAYATSSAGNTMPSRRESDLSRPSRPLWDLVSGSSHRDPYGITVL